MKRTLETLQVGTIVKGTVKNIADFGVHRPGRHRRAAAHHRHVVGPDQPPQRDAQDRPGGRGQGLSIDKEKEKIAAGPQAEGRQPLGEHRDQVPGRRVHEGDGQHHVLRRFVKLEEGVEGLVHISEMSWTKRINHPSEVVTAQKVLVKVLEINKDSRRSPSG